MKKNCFWTLVGVTTGLVGAYLIADLVVPEKTSQGRQKIMSWLEDSSFKGKDLAEQSLEKGTQLLEVAKLTAKEGKEEFLASHPDFVEILNKYQGDWRSLLLDLSDGIIEGIQVVNSFRGK